MRVPASKTNCPFRLSGSCRTVSGARRVVHRLVVEKRPCLVTVAHSNIATGPAKGTVALAIRENLPHFTSVPAQYVENDSDQMAKKDIGGNCRTFSIPSAPLEDKLIFVMRLSNSASMGEPRSLPLGSEI